MATNYSLLGIICLIVNYSCGLSVGNFLKAEGRKQEAAKVEGWKVEGLGFSVQRLAPCRAGFYSSATANRKLSTVNRERILRIAQSQLGVREATGRNDGKEVEAYLGYTNNKKGEPWCASFVSWVYGKAGFVQPKTAWSPSLFPLARQTLNPKPADIFGIYFANLQRIAHCGLVEGARGNWIYTIEGNTNSHGSRDGDGVYRKLRHQRSIKYYANWVDQRREVGHE